MRLGAVGSRIGVGKASKNRAGDDAKSASDEGGRGGT